MLVTASTVKDTLTNVQRFVTGNLAGGADHMFVFLDAGDPGVWEYLEQHPHVTAVQAETLWWRGERPDLLNVRQRINANVVKALLSTVEGVDWVFHVDADEVIQVDRAVLDTVSAETRAVKLATLEAVSRKSWDGDPTWFKRLLGKDDLTLLRTLGVLDRASNGSYFHGHVEGKAGVRPALDVWLALHRGIDAAREELPAFQHEALRVLHYESFSVEEFVRKWTSILAAGPLLHLRPAREPTAVAMRALMGKGLTEEQLTPYLMRIFERTTEDDFETLRDLGLLVEVDPKWGTHQPAAFPAIDEVRRLLERVAAEPKLAFHPGEPVEAAQKVLDAVTGGYGSA